jgi:hypothetical protein
MQTDHPRMNDIEIRRAFSNLEFMRPINREELTEAIYQGDASRAAVKQALLDYMEFWSDANWVDNSVSVVGFWLVADTPEEFHEPIREIAISKQDLAALDEKRAWLALLNGMDEAAKRRPKVR